MKNKKILTAVLTLLVAGGTITTPIAKDFMPTTITAQAVNTSVRAWSNQKTYLCSNSGSHWIRISTTSPKTKVYMYDSRGNLVWSEDNAIRDRSRRFYLGSNVKKVYVKTSKTAIVIATNG